MQQGEIAEGVSEKNFNFNPFNNDGTINYDSQEVVFDVSWNQPADYDFNTGLVDLNRTGIKPDGTYSTQPQFNSTYTAIKCKNIFSKGRFEQELEGRLLVEYEKNQVNAESGRVTVSNPATQNGTRSSSNSNETNADWVDVNGLQVLRSDVTDDTESNQEGAAPQLLNSPPPAPPTSDGDIESFNATPENPIQAGIIDNPDAQLRNRDT